ncbi:MAG: 50S ribosomal protein L15 [Thermomicrobiales bacterium]|jgi:large subunit ribosomal protein L15|nr:50S ribosomal protein L15 [Thermomicrobiales bacterium]
MPTNLTDLKPNQGANKDRTRVGRGHGSGKGKTAGRGTKGQKSRTGGSIRVGFEGGQLPLQKRMPYKRGFTNIFQTPWEVVNLRSLNDLNADGPITPELLDELGLIRGTEFPVKVLATGELSGKIEVHAHAFSEAAKEAIEKQGGSVVVLERTDRWVTARPRNRKLPIDRELKSARLGKVGGIERRSELTSS